MERNVTLDYFKIILSILIITIHIYYPYQTGQFYIGWYIPEGIARIGVPFFFLVNGYYFANKIGNFNSVKKYLIHLLIIYTTWFIIYLKHSLERSDQFYIISDFRLDLLLEKYLDGIFHLWYLPALFFGIMLLIFLKKIIKKDSAILLISIVLYTLGCILQLMKTDYSLFRNGLFFGFPFIAIGYYLRGIDLKKIKNQYLVILVILFLISLSIESTYAMKIVFRKDLYFSLIFLVPTIFLLLLKHSKYKSPNKYYEYIGSLSSAIYFSHMFVIHELENIYKDISVVEKFLIITFISFFVSILIIFINKRIKIFL